MRCVARPVAGRVVVVDEVARVGRADHVEVQVELDLVLLGRRQRGHVVLRAEQAELLGAPEAEPDVVPRRDAAGGEGQGVLQDAGGAGAVVVDARAGRHGVEVGAGHHHVVRVAAGPVGDEVVGRPGGRRERLHAGGVAGGVELGPHPVERGEVAGAAGGAVAAVGVRDGLELVEVGPHVGDRDVGRGGEGGRRASGQGRPARPTPSWR